jgi:hypothetical protein
MKKVTEIYTGQVPQTIDVSMKVVIEDGKELDLHLSRDIAINLIQQLYVSLDAKGVNKPKDLH